MVMSNTEAIVKTTDGVAVVDLAGDINANAEEELGRAYDEATNGDASTILLNFERVGYINSTGIALIVGAMAKARKEGLTMAACGLSEHYRHIFEITRLVDFMHIFPDEESALNDSRRKGEANA
jgi:anti-anti-sigma factor